MENNNIIEKIKSAFCRLTKFKIRENALEVITAYSTVNNKFISIFITFTNNKFVLTDNGWIDQNYYETPLNDESEYIIKRIIGSFKNSFSVKSTTDATGIEYYYKTCKTINEIPSAVFDLANFAVGVVNSFCIQYKDEKEEKQRETFRKDANNFLKTNYVENVRLRKSLDDFKNIKFNAIVNKGMDLFLLTYVTGSTPYYFENDLRKSIVNFEITVRSKYKDYIKEKISIFNDRAEGFNPQKSKSIIELLKEKTTREPILWSEKEKVLEII